MNSTDQVQSPTSIQDVSLDQLLFDPENPRFSLFETSTDEQVIGRMTETENVQELMGSIGEQGYFSGEPLLVAPAQPATSPETYVVVEGNRRLAALKLLAGKIKIDRPSIAALVASATHKDETAPCIVFAQRRDILRYLGYRHITGAKRWDPLPKARYLQQLKQEFFSHLPDEEQHKMLAKEIGSRSDYVAQMLSGLNVYDQAKSADFYSLSGVNDSSVDFSLLTTALSYRSIYTYAGLSSKSDVVGAGLVRDHCRDLFLWMYSPREDGFTILGESRNLKILAAVLDKEPATQYLKAEKNLQKAFLMSEGPTRAFEKFMRLVIDNLKGAYAVVPDISDVDESHQRAVAAADDLVQDLRSSIRRRMRDKADMVPLADKAAGEATDQPENPTSEAGNES